MKLFDIIERKTLFEVVNRIILVATLAGLEKLCVPFKRAIPYNQWLEYLYPYQEDTVSEFLLMLFVLSLLVMMILIAIMQIMILMIPRKESVIVDVPAVENSNDVGSSGNTSNQNNNNAPSSTEIPQSTKKLIQKKDTKEILRLEPKLRKSLIAAEVTDILLGYSFAILLTLIITVLGKNLVGKPRPDYFNRCFPCVDLNNYNEIISFLDKMDDLPNFECQNIGGDKQQDDTQQNLTLSNQASSLILRSISDCNDTKINCDTKCQLNGRRSFPSGHSATAWVIFSFTAFFLFGKLNTFLAKNRSQTIRLLPGFSMFAIALWISISRTQDYRHDYYDVLCGGLIGLICGWIGYKTNYPKLNCAKANYSRRQVRILDDH